MSKFRRFINRQCVLRVSLSGLKSDILETQSPKCIRQKGSQNQFSFVYIVAKCNRSIETLLEDSYHGIKLFPSIPNFWLKWNEQTKMVLFYFFKTSDVFYCQSFIELLTLLPTNVPRNPREGKDKCLRALANSYLYKKTKSDIRKSEIQ